ncbi:right-handed parallel beta-helix repeat-containing protein [Sphingobium sp. TB-6]|nr:right-handed parallel beta-helix repeat-containing protein [Sphingobium sp. TB-6]
MASEAVGQLREPPAFIRVARILAAFLCFITFLSAANATARDHYVDAARGDDRNDGLTPASPWRSLAQVRQASLGPGDRVLLMAGSVWKEPLEIRRSGGRKAPIIFTTFGTGPRPRIDVGGRFDYGVAILNAEYVEVGGLEVTNESETPSPRYGVLISQKDTGVARNIIVRDMYIHDIRGTNDRKDNGGIIFQALASTRATRFHNLVIERNIIWRADRSGIAGISDQVTPDRWFPSEGVVIRDNYLDDIGGDGIVPRGTDGALVEHNIVYRAAARATGYKVAIWQWSTDNTLIQLNEVGFTHGRWDGQGFDSDFNSRRTTIAYNFSHDNEGGFVLICSPDRTRADNMGNVGTVVSRNVSRHDGARIVQLAGPISHARIESNVIYVGKDQDVTMIAATHWDGWANDVSFSNNMFAVAGTARYGHEIGRDGPKYLVAAGFPHSQALRFEGNRFLGRHVDPPDDSRGIWEPEYQGTAADWSAPTFDPAAPVGFDVYLANHRRWMLAMLARELGQPVKLLAARRSSWMEARPRPAP